jgi:hypothetical protein
MKSAAVGRLGRHRDPASGAFAAAVSHGTCSSHEARPRGVESP